MTANGLSTVLLSRLAGMEKILIKQKKEILESFETNNKYVIVDPSDNQQIYYAKEETDCCMRYWCGSARSFVIHLLDSNNVNVLKISRPMKCRMGPCCSCVGCCQEDLMVECPPGHIIGTVHQNYGCCELNLDLMDETGSRTLSVTRNGNCAHCVCTSCCCWHQDIEFPIISTSGGLQIGSVMRNFPGYFKEIFTDADNFTVNFPRDMQLEAKAMILATALLIDFMYFESDKKDDNNF